MFDGAYFGSNVVGAAVVKLSLDTAEFDAQLAAAKAKLASLGGGDTHVNVGSTVVAGGGGGRLLGGWGGRILGGLLLANQIFPLTTALGALVVAIGSVVATVGGLMAVGAGMFYFSKGMDTVTAKASSFDKSVYTIANQLGNLGAQARAQFTGSGSGLLGGVSVFVSQAGGILQGFIAKLRTLGGSFMQAFFGSAPGGRSVFQQWGDIITNFVNTAGKGLLNLFIHLQAPAQAFVQGLGSVIHAFAGSAIFSPGLISLTTQFIQKFFGVLTSLVPILERFSTTMDSAGIAVLNFIHDIMPAISTMFSVAGNIEKIAAALLTGLGFIIKELLRIPVLGAAIQSLLGVAGALWVLNRAASAFGVTSIWSGLVAGFNWIRNLVAFGGVGALLAYAGALAAVGLAFQSLDKLMAEFNSHQQAYLADFTNNSQATYAQLKAVYEQQKANLSQQTRGANPFTDLAAKGELDALNAAWAQYNKNLHSSATNTALWAQETQAAAASAKSAISSVVGATMTQQQAGGLANFLKATGSSFNALKLTFQQDSLNIATSAQNVQQQVTAFGNSWLQMDQSIAQSFGSLTITAKTGFTQFMTSLKQQQQTMNQWGKAQTEILKKVGTSAQGFLTWAAQQGPSALKLLTTAAGKSTPKLQEMVNLFNGNQKQSQTFAQTIMNQVVGSLTTLTKSFFKLAYQMGAITWAQYQSDIAGLGAAAQGAAGGFNTLAAAARAAAKAVAAAGLPGHGVGGVTGHTPRGAGYGTSAVNNVTINTTQAASEVRKQLASSAVIV